ncbi:MAG: RNA-directed DNA polymerase [Ramlibacter sp.]|nr:RNA-directed DNA polymerase [Ramlibacter sp.]
MPKPNHSYRRWVATGLAHALLADAHKPGGATSQALHARAIQCLGADHPWLLPLIAAMGPHSVGQWRRHSVASLAEYIDQLPAFDAAFLGQDSHPHIRRLLLRPDRMLAPPFELAQLGLPRLASHADLAQWLGISPERLQWLIEPAQNFRESEAAPGQPHCHPGRHYRQLLKQKNSGGLRLVEAPKSELKRVQKRLLSGLLNKIPVHEKVHGFVRGRGVLTHASEHAGRHTVLAFDLSDFFSSIGVARIKALWQTLGYPEAVARALAALCTTRTPLAVRQRLMDAGGINFFQQRRLASAHLPQGAPTSPALANLCAFMLDLRLDGLAWRFGANYSRYADDLVFSGSELLARDQRKLTGWVAAIVEAEGFRVHPRKTRVLLKYGRQRVTGVVVNTRPNLGRDDYDRLRAELHRLAGADRLDKGVKQRMWGRISWACQTVCASRAAKLYRLFEALPNDHQGAGYDASTS